MKSKRSLALIVLELVTVLLLTTLVVTWGRRAAMLERGYEAIGGEYLLLAFPVFYYASKRIIRSLGAELWKVWR